MHLQFRCNFPRDQRLIVMMLMGSRVDMQTIVQIGLTISNDDTQNVEQIGLTISNDYAEGR